MPDLSLTWLRVVPEQFADGLLPDGGACDWIARCREQEFVVVGHSDFPRLESTLERNEHFIKVTGRKHSRRCDIDSGDGHHQLRADFLVGEVTKLRQQRRDLGNKGSNPDEFAFPDLVFKLDLLSVMTTSARN